ncbi:hypothetical protein [Paracoccus methylarcula]|nr:hypothetical protein [Paracoccus methylarcula]
MLYTSEFQAAYFYQRNGWPTIGEAARDPPGSARIFMTRQS